MSDIREAILKEGVVFINDQCKGCDDCVKVCPNDAITVAGLGTKHVIDPEKCLSCGQCLITCPFARIEEKSMLDDVRAALAGDKIVMVQEAPAVRAALGVEFGLPEGTDTEGKMLSAMRELGFDKVYDTVFGADLTIMEEGHELVARILKSLGVKGYEDAEAELPQFTSCCPGWVRYAELNHSDMLAHLSTAKSPMMMHGAIMKTYGAEQLGIDPADIYSVAVMPCTAKKRECSRPEFVSSGYPDVDAVITTRELAQMIRDAGIDFEMLDENGKADSVMGEGTGAGVIFGNTGGVMEAALRTAYKALSGKELEQIEVHAVRGEDSVREATVSIPLKAEIAEAAGVDTFDLNVAVVSGTANVETVFDKIESGSCPYHFVEVMNCPGGCVNGGGQPINHTIL
ncbi:MAG: [FeFe] hydrogenase, group A [Slackia sp.]|nr:[FeFe] hydrogenase, group A [Slackia sp.]